MYNIIYKCIIIKCIILYIKVKYYVYIYKARDVWGRARAGGRRRGPPRGPRLAAPCRPGARAGPARVNKGIKKIKKYANI